ncbi:unnamed protein product [Echinostoma caproni]|uniref:Uncharacterized protein n=1 Tax=Echinostoma caproni TaxID=27848 RepID=A0A183A168_9TREM|nr:unnamed protein product [Echinostoma caproni]
MSDVFYLATEESEEYACASLPESFDRLNSVEPGVSKEEHPNTPDNKKQVGKSSRTSGVVRCIAHGSDPQLLGPRVVPRGPNRQLVRGPDPKLPRGPDRSLLLGYHSTDSLNRAVHFGMVKSILCSDLI